MGSIGEVMNNFVTNYESSLTEASKDLKSGMEDDMRGTLSSKFLLTFVKSLPISRALSHLLSLKSKPRPLVSTRNL